MQNRPYYAVMLGALIAGSSGAIIKFLNMVPTSLAFYRVFVPVAVLGVWLLIRQQPILRKGWKAMLGGSALNAVRTLLFYMAYTYAAITNAVVILFTWPVFVALFEAIAFRERIPLRKIGLLALSFSGILIIYSSKGFSLEDENFLGMLAALGSAAVYASTVIIFKVGRETYNGGETIFFQNLLGVPLFLPFLITNPQSEAWQIGGAIGFSAVAGLGIFGLFFYALKRLKASTASMLAYLEILSASLFGILLYGEPITWQLLLGGGFILASTLLLQFSKA